MQPDGSKYCLPVDENYAHALSRDIKHLRHAGLFLWSTFFRRCKTTRVHFVAYVALRGINKATALGAVLILMADLELY